MSALQAVFFDFDGVIADSEPLHLRAYQAVLQADGIDLNKTDYYARYLGYDDVGLFEALAKDRGISLSDEKIEEWVVAKSCIVEEMLTSDAIAVSRRGGVREDVRGTRAAGGGLRSARTGDRDRPRTRRPARLRLRRLHRHPMAFAASPRLICTCWRWQS